MAQRFGASFFYSSSINGDGKVFLSNIEKTMSYFFVSFGICARMQEKKNVHSTFPLKLMKMKLQ